MKYWMSLLAFIFLIGCDGEKSNVAPSKGSPEEAAAEVKPPEAVSVNPNLKYVIKGDTVTITGCDKKASGELIIPANIEGKPVTSIGEYYAFYNCTSLTSITIPDSVTSIGVGAFMSCTSLTRITIPDGVTSIGGYAFSNCTSLTRITIPDGVTSIGFAAFGSSSLTTIEVGAENVNYTDVNGVLFNKEKTLLHTYPADKTGDNYVIPDSVTSIGVGAFMSCTSLTRITIPDGVTSIESGTFLNCTSLTSITIPDSITHIGDQAFLGTPTVFTEVENINFLLGREGKRAYLIDGSQASGAINLPTMVGGAEVSLISGSAFRNCTSLTSITIPSSVTSIGTYAFADCTALTSITIPDGVTSIGVAAFYSCTSLTSITIPDGVTSIGQGAFNDCTSLTNIEVGAENVNYADVNGVLFNKGKTLLHTYPAGKAGDNYTIPDSVTSIGENAFRNCPSLTSITIGNGVTSIGNRAFYACTSLTSITIPDSVTSIGNFAFVQCTNLTSITIGNGVTSIGKFAFKDCTSLTAVTFLGDAPKIEDNAFEKSSPTIYRKPDAKGWGDTLAGRPVKLITEKP